MHMDNQTLEFQNYEMDQLYRQMAVNCAPTILGEKPASLFCVKNKPNLIKNFENQQPLIEKVFGVETFLLKCNENHLIILLYNVTGLTDVLEDLEVKQFLKTIGYEVSGPLKSLLNQLKINFQMGCPHEIGIFLGYPIVDVKAFLEPQSKCLLCGYWKVFSNTEAAQKTFDRYDQAKETVIAAFARGLNLHEFLAYIY